jgi:hypothetical protein
MARFSRMVVLAKIESTYATDSVPTNTANAMLFQEVDWTPMEAEQVERPMVVPHFGVRPVSLVAQRNRLAGAVDIAGSAAAGTAPAFGPLLRACGLSETIVASTSVTYAPVSAGEESVSLYHYAEGKQQAGLGARGTFDIDIQNNAIPRIRFDLQGLYVAPTAVALPAPTLTAWQSPLPVSQANTPTVTLGGQAVKLRGFTYTHGNQMQVRDMPNLRAIRIMGRQPSATLTIEDPDALTPNFFTMIGTTQAFSLVHGLTAGNICTVNLGQARVLNPRYSDEENARMLTLDLRPEPTMAGNNEISIAFT